MTLEIKTLNKIRDSVIEMKGTITTLLRDARKDCEKSTDTERAKLENNVDQLGKLFDEINFLEKYVLNLYNEDVQ